MRRSRWLLLVSFVVISSMLAWACGGGGEEKPTPAAGGGGGDLSGLAEKFGKSTFKVTYQLSGAGAGMTGMTWYKKGDNLRFDVTSEIEGQQTSLIMITLSDKSYFCTSTPELGGGGSCFETPSGEGTGVSEMVSGLESTLTDPNVDIVSTSSRKIAGEDTKCYTVQSPDEGESEVCMTDEGVPLLSKETVAGGEMTMEATDFSRDVSDSDFEPPYPVSALPSGAGTP